MLAKLNMSISQPLTNFLTPQQTSLCYGKPVCVTVTSYLDPM